MEKRLANIITTPGMILAVIMASGLLYMQPVYLTQTWMQIKLLFVAFLLIYHFYCYRIMNELTNKQYILMEKRLANIITTPGMILAVIMASGLLYMQPIYLTQTWMQIKLLFVAFLIIYHFYCYKIMNELTNNQYNYSGQQLRALNELPTLLLVVVVMLVVFKNQFPTSAASWLIFGLILFMAASIQFYAKWRRNKKQLT